MNQQDGGSPTRDHSDGYEAVIAASESDAAHHPQTPESAEKQKDISPEKGWYVPKQRRRKLKAYLRQFCRAGADRHIELILAFAIVFFAGFQLWVTISNNQSSTAEANKLLDAANQIKSAGWTFSGAAIGINNAGWSQADQIKRSADAAFSGVSLEREKVEARLQLDDWMGIYHSPNQVFVQINFVNQGHNPADHISVAAIIDVRQKPPTKKDYRFAHNAFHAPENTTMIYPFIKGNTDSDYVAMVHLANNISVDAGSKSVIYVWGVVKYKDFTLTGLRLPPFEFCRSVSADKVMALPSVGNSAGRKDLNTFVAHDGCYGQ